MTAIGIGISPAFGSAAGAGAAPPAAPDAPTGLTATAVSGSQIDLEWYASANATGYKIERSDGDDQNFVQIDTVGEVEAYEDTGLSSGIYYYRIRATSAAGDSGYSNTATAVVYLLRDEFTTDRAAGAVNDTAAEPGPGTRSVVDTTSVMPISGGKLVADGTATIGNPRYYLDAISRVHSFVGSSARYHSLC